MAAFAGPSVEEFLPDLKGMIFLNPQTKQWETEDQYLSGNVREKLVAADAASVGDPRFRENVEALKSVQPQDLPATEIDVRLGASWLPPIRRGKVRPRIARRSVRRSSQPHPRARLVARHRPIGRPNARRPTRPIGERAVTPDSN